MVQDWWDTELPVHNQGEKVVIHNFIPLPYPWNWSFAAACERSGKDEASQGDIDTNWIICASANETLARFWSSATNHWKITRHRTSLVALPPRIHGDEVWPLNEDLNLSRASGDHVVQKHYFCYKCLPMQLAFCSHRRRLLSRPTVFDKEIRWCERKKKQLKTTQSRQIVVVSKQLFLICVQVYDERQKFLQTQRVVVCRSSTIVEWTMTTWA